MEIFIKFERDVVYVQIWYFLIWNDHVLLIKRRHLEWRIKIVVLLKTCPGLIRKRYTLDQSFDLQVKLTVYKIYN